MFLFPCSSIKMYYSFIWLCCITLCFNFIYQYYPSSINDTEYSLYIIPSLFLYSISKICPLIYSIIYNNFFKSNIKQIITTNNSITISSSSSPNIFILIALLSSLSLFDPLFSVTKYDSRLRVIHSFNNRV